MGLQSPLLLINRWSVCVVDPKVSTREPTSICLLQEGNLKAMKALPISFVNMKCRSTLMLGDRWQAESQAIMMSRLQYLNHKWVLKKSLTSLGLSDNHYIKSSPEWHQFMSGLSSLLNSGVPERRCHSSAFHTLTTWSQAWNVAINWHYMDE